MKTDSHIIHLATPDILVSASSMALTTEEEIFVQIAKLSFIRFDEDHPEKGFEEIFSLPIDETGYFSEFEKFEQFIRLGKPGDTISRYDSRLLHLDYGWEKSKEDPDMTELESALKKKGLVIDTTLPSCLTMTIYMYEEDDCFSFKAKRQYSRKNEIGFVYYLLFDDILDFDTKQFRPDFRFDNEEFAYAVMERITEIGDAIPIPEIRIELRCGYLGEKPVSEIIPGFDLKEIVDSMNNEIQETSYNITIDA